MKESFFVVMNEGRGLSQSPMRHRGYDDARREAERLARANPGQRFFVLCTVGCAVKDDVRWEPHDGEWQIPF